MLSSVYVVKGCFGAQVFEEVAQFSTIGEARKRARKLNQKTADGRGVHYRYYLRSCRPNAEGMHAEGQRGMDGRRI